MDHQFKNYISSHTKKGFLMTEAKPKLEPHLAMHYKCNNIIHLKEKFLFLTQNSMSAPIDWLEQTFLSRCFLTMHDSKFSLEEVKGTTITRGKKICNP